MNWFSICLLYESVRSDNNPNVWEEVIELVQADTAKEAEKIALSMSHKREESYTNENGDTISVRFRVIERVFQIEESKIFSGVEIFSRFLKASEVESILTKFD